MASSPSTEAFQSNVNFDALKVIFVIGAPASGKGTLCKLLSTQKSYYHLSVGDHLRNIVARGANDIFSSPPEKVVSLLKGYLDRHELVPVDIIIGILRMKLTNELAKGATTFLIDGFPRDEASTIAFEEKIKEPHAVIWFDCPREIALHRFLVRRRGGINDTVAVFEKRYDEFMRNNDVLVKRYWEKHILQMVESGGETEVTMKKVLALKDL